MTALLLGASGCGPLHTPAGDADGDEGMDAAPDGDADGEPDADAGDAGDVDPELDADPDFEASETTWLLASGGDPTWRKYVRWLEPFPGGGFVAAGEYGVQWLARVDSTGDVLWAVTIASRFGSALSSLSVAADGQIFVTTGDRIAAFDADGRVLWQRQTGTFLPVVQGLPDGSVVLLSVELLPAGLHVMRYSPVEGVLWSWSVEASVAYRGASVAASEAGTIFLAVGPLVLAVGVEGDLLWAGRWSGGPVPVDAAVPTEAGGLLLVGGRTISVARLDADGRLEWHRSMGRYERHEPWNPPCAEWPCLLDGAMDAAVAPTGEAMVVGVSTSAAERLGWEVHTAAYALWLDRDGVVTRTLGMVDQGEEGWGAYAGAALADGGWAVGGNRGPDLNSGYGAFLARLDAPGWPGGDCSYGSEASLGQTSLDASLEPEELTLSPSELEVVEGEPLVFAHLDAPMERLCW